MKYFWLSKNIFNCFVIFLVGDVIFDIFLKKCSKREQIHIFSNHISNQYTQDLIEIFCTISRDRYHIHFLIFTLNSSREAASLYSDGSFAQRDDVLYVILIP